MFRVGSFSSRSALLKSPAVPHHIRFYKLAAPDPLLQPVVIDDKLADRYGRPIAERKEKWKSRAKSKEKLDKLLGETVKPVRKSKTKSNVEKKKRTEDVLPRPPRRPGTSTPPEKRNRMPVIARITGSDLELPTKEQCDTLSDDHCRLLMDHQDREGTPRKLPAWNLPYQPELIRYYMQMMTFEEIAEKMKPRLNLSASLYQTRFSKWRFPTSSLSHRRENTVRQLFRMIRDRGDYPSKEQSPKPRDSDISISEAAREVGNVAVGTSPDQRSTAESTVIGLATIEYLERHPEKSVNSIRPITHINNRKIIRENSIDSGSAKRSYAEWKDKAGLLYAPKNTGSPEADSTSNHILAGYGGDTSHKKRRVLCDARRIHIVQKELCDDVLERLGPSLEKHMGCDIVDVNPGPGVWSAAVHRVLKPRTHILMEPDHELFEPLLQPLVDAPDSTYKLFPKNGIVWSHLGDILTPENFPHQTILTTEDPRRQQPNNTLLVMANLGSYPKKVYRGFPSISTLAIYQFLAAARENGLFHKYGLVRMLLWVADNEKHILLPRTTLFRRKGSILAELSCSDISEVASSTHVDKIGMREHSLDVESCRRTLNRMEEAGLSIPEERAKPIQLEAMGTDVGEDRTSVKWSWVPELEDLERRYDAGEFHQFLDPKNPLNIKGSVTIEDYWTPEYQRYQYLFEAELRAKKKGQQFGSKSGIDHELARLRAGFAGGELPRFIVPVSEVPNTMGMGSDKYMTREFLRMRKLRRLKAQRIKSQGRFDPLFDEFDHILEMQKRMMGLDGLEAALLKDEILQRTGSWKEKIHYMPDHESDVFLNQLDNRIALYQDPPLLYWDRRKVEPLNVKATEFFPRHEMALLDYQPKDIWPILREDFPANFDIFELLIGSLMNVPTQTVCEAFQGMYPGAYEWLVAKCPSLTDPNKGGNMDLELLRVRCLTLEMWKEIVEAWLKWPFRPPTFEMMRRTGSHAHDADEESWHSLNEAYTGFEDVSIR